MKVEPSLARIELVESGSPLADASGALILVHGRGATATGMIPLGHELELPGLALLAPQAPSHTWYPSSFLAPRSDNEPALSASLAILDATIRHAVEAGVAEDRVFLLGFSQGACLVIEYAYRRSTPVGGVVGLTGGLIGPPGSIKLASEPALDQMAVLLASSDPDPHVPWPRVEETARLFEKRGAAVQLQRYPGLGHTVIPDEIEGARDLLGAALSRVDDTAAIASERRR